MTLYTCTQLAELLGISRSTVRALTRAGEFGETVNVARRHLVTEEGLAAFVAAHTGPAYNREARAQAQNRRRHVNPGPI